MNGLQGLLREAGWAGGVPLEPIPTGRERNRFDFPRIGRGRGHMLPMAMPLVLHRELAGGLLRLSRFFAHVLELDDDRPWFMKRAAEATKIRFKMAKRFTTEFPAEPQVYIDEEEARAARGAPMPATPATLEEARAISSQASLRHAHPQDGPGDF